jgi:hypothetical protein
MKLRTTDVIILLALGLLCIGRATWGLFKDINVDLRGAGSVTGQVTYAGIIEMEATTFTSKKYKTVFALRLKNSNQNFAIDRGVDFCNYLNTQIQIGDIIRIHYRPGPGEYNTFVYQIEKGQKIVAGFSDYKKREIQMIILAYIFGFILLGGLTLWYIKKRRQTGLLHS